MTDLTPVRAALEIAESILNSDSYGIAAEQMHKALAHLAAIENTPGDKTPNRKCESSAIDDSRGLGSLPGGRTMQDPSTKPEITPEMIRAGEDVLIRELCMVNMPCKDEIAKAVFVAMFETMAMPHRGAEHQATESVSLGKCAQAVRNVFDLSLVGPDSGFKAEEVAKAVLDSAGVKYVD